MIGEFLVIYFRKHNWMPHTRMKPGFFFIIVTMKKDLLSKMAFRSADLSKIFSS